MLTERLTFLRRVALLLGALVLVHAVNGCEPDPAPPSSATAAVTR